MALPLLVDPAWLAGDLQAPDLRVIDASWYLPAAERDARAEFEKAHIPGATYLDLSTDLADAEAPVRNTLPPADELGRRFAAAGIGTDHRVVIYDCLGGYSAGRVFWTLRYAGHDKLALLDGGFERWLAEGRPVTQELRDLAPARFNVNARPELVADRDRVLASLTDGKTLLVDARSPARFRGEEVEKTARRGHIPGSINVPYGENLAGEPPRLVDRARLRAHYEARGVRFDRPVITTCGSGVTASLDAFALLWLGHPDVAVYDGSWAEWGNDPDVPVEGQGG